VNDSWTDASLSLEWVEGVGDMDCGTVTVSLPALVSTHAQCSVAELTAVIRCSEPGVPRLSLHRGTHPPIKLQFSG